MFDFRRAVLTAALLALPLLSSAVGNSAHVNYMLHCQGCHLPGGIGHPGIVPTLRGQMGRFLHSEAGRAYLVQVPGAAQSALNDSELAEVINWMLANFDPSGIKPDFKRFNGAEVGQYRRIEPHNLSATRRKILAR